MLPARDHIRYLGGLLQATAKHSPDLCSSLVKLLQEEESLFSLILCLYPVEVHGAHLENLRDGQRVPSAQGRSAIHDLPILNLGNIKRPDTVRGAALWALPPVL